METLTVDLFPWDAGTEEGEKLSFDNAATVPQGTITPCGAWPPSRMRRSRH